MGIATLKAGLILERDNRRHQMRRLLPGNLWQFEACDTGMLTTLPLAQILEEYRQGAVRLVAHEAPRPPKLHVRLEEMPSPMQDAIRRRLAYVRAVAQTADRSTAALRAKIANIAERLVDSDPPSVSTVNRWRARLLDADGDASALYAHRWLCGRRTRRYPEELYAFVDQAIDEKYMSPQRGSVDDTHKRAVNLVEQENRLRPKAMRIEYPSERFVRRRIGLRSRFDMMAARFGARAAARAFRSVHQKITAEAPLETVQIDHTRLDVIVVDGDTLVPLDRPWLTVLIDVSTRYILGFCISFEPPSARTVMEAIRHAVLPKPRHEGLASEWDAWGTWDRLVTDNGAEFHGSGLDLGCARLGIEVLYNEAGQPEHKGIVERFFRTLAEDLIHKFPGTTFSNPTMLGFENPVKRAVVTLSLLKAAIEKWIVDVYHARPHSSLGESPADAWTRQIPGVLRRLPDSIEDLMASFSPAENRVLTHAGIDINGLRYHAPELDGIRKRGGPRVEVRVRIVTEDVSKILVEDPLTKDFVQAEVLPHALEYAKGLSLHQHEQIRKWARREGQSASGLKALAQAKEDIAAMVRRALTDSKATLRSRVASFAGSGTEGIRPERHTTPHKADRQDSLAREVELERIPKPTLSMEHLSVGLEDLPPPAYLESEA